MAKHPDDLDPKRKPDQDEPFFIDEVEEVLEADVVPDEPTPAHKKDSKRDKKDGPPAPPTQVAPLEWDSGGTVRPGPVHKGPAAEGHEEMPNFSLDQPEVPSSYLTGGGPHVLHDEPAPAPKPAEDSWVVEAAEVVDETSDVLDAEPVVEGSSVIEVAEVVEEPSAVLAGEPIHVTGESSVVEVAELAEDDASSEVMAEEFEKRKHESSVISASVIEAESFVEAAEVVNEGSSVVEALPASDVVLSADEVTPATGSSAQDPSGMKAVPATPPPLMADDVFEADFLAIQEEEEKNRDAGSIFGADVPEEVKPAFTESMAKKEEAFDEILGASHADGKDAPSEKTPKTPRKAKAEAVEDDTVDLGSDPEVNVDPSDLEKLLQEKMKPAAAQEIHAAEEEINWDDIETVGGSKVVKQMEDADQSAAHDSVNETHADDDFLVAEDVSGNDESSGVDLGKKADGKLPLSGIDPVAEALESGIDLDDEPGRKKKKKTAGELVTELDTGPLPADDDVHFDSDTDVPTHKAHADEEDEAVQGLLDDEDHHDGVDAAVLAEDEEPPVEKSAPGKKKPPADRKLVGTGPGGRGWLTGALATTGIFAVLAAVLWFLAPSLIESISKSSPSYVAPIKVANRIDPGPGKAPAANANLQKVEAELKTAQQTNAAIQTELKTNKAQMNALKDQADKAERAKKDATKDFTALADVLVKEKLIEGADKLNPASFQKILGDLAENKASLAAVNKLLDDAKINGPGDKGVANLLTAKKDVEEKIETLSKTLADETAAREKLAKDRDELDQAIKGAYKELAGTGLVPPDDDPRAKIVDAVKRARNQAESPLALPLTQLATALSGLGTSAGKMVEKGFDYATLGAELGFYRLREPLILSPDRKLDNYITLFQDASNKDRPDLDLALREVAWVLAKESKSTTEAQLKALVITGLAGRLQGNFEAARKILELATKTGAAYADAPWMKPAFTALKELNEPDAYYQPRAEKFMFDGNSQAAEETLNLGLKAFPGNPRLLARRALVRLELAQENKALLPKYQKEIRADAEAAAKDADAGAEGTFVLGLLEEELGHFDKAESDYRKAIKMHHGSADDYSRYIIALARLLQRDRNSIAAPAPPMNDEPAEPKAKDDPEPKKSARLEMIRELLICALVGVQAADEEFVEDPVSAARIQESIDLANKLIESLNTKIKGQGYMILGQALSKKGKRTDGLKEYVKGLELLYPGTVSKEIAKLLDEHPAFQQPEAIRANPLLAEQYYGKGLHLFWARNYGEAAGQFKKAVQFYNLDARYHYFLGLSLLAQKSSAKRDAAYYAFEQGARLEAANRPGLTDVNASLERLQGPLRALVDAYRQKALASAN